MHFCNFLSNYRNLDRFTKWSQEFGNGYSAANASPNVDNGDDEHDEDDGHADNVQGVSLASGRKPAIYSPPVTSTQGYVRSQGRDHMNHPEAVVPSTGGNAIPTSSRYSGR